MQSLIDKLEEWALETLPEAHVAEFHKQQVLHSAQRWFRTDANAKLCRWEKEREKQTKRSDAIAEAEARYRDTDPKELVALAVLEISGKLRPEKNFTSQQDGKPNNVKKTAIPKTGALGHMLQSADQETLKKFNIELVDGTRNGARSKSTGENGKNGKKGKTPSRSPSRHSRSASGPKRSASQTSRRSSSAGSQKPRPKPRSATPKPILKKQGRAVNFTDENATNSRSKGKGKGKGKNRGSSKGRGKGKSRGRGSSRGPANSSKN